MVSARDPHRFVNELEPAMIERLVERLESRGRDKVFAHLFENYAAKLSLPANSQALEIGSGTGVVARALAARSDVLGHVTGIDQSPAFVEIAQGLPIVLLLLAIRRSYLGNPGKQGLFGRVSK